MEPRLCPRCAREQPTTATGEKCLFCGAELAAEAHAPVPPESALPAVLTAGKRECPNCREVLYDTERRCWRCGHEFEESPRLPQPPAESPPATVPPPAAPAPPQPTPPAIPPAPEPASAATAVPYVGSTVPPPGANEAQALGVWAFILGVFSFCCPVLCSIFAIYLGSKARARGAGGLATAGHVLGIITLVIGLILTILMIIGFLVEEDEPSSPSSSLTPWLPLARTCTRCLLRSLV